MITKIGQILRITLSGIQAFVCGAFMVTTSLLEMWMVFENIF